MSGFGGGFTPGGNAPDFEVSSVWNMTTKSTKTPAAIRKEKLREQAKKEKEITRLYTTAEKCDAKIEAAKVEYGRALKNLLDAGETKASIAKRMILTPTEVNSILTEFSEEEESENGEEENNDDEDTAPAAGEGEDDDDVTVDRDNERPTY